MLVSDILLSSNNKLQHSMRFDMLGSSGDGLVTASRCVGIFCCCCNCVLQIVTIFAAASSSSSSSSCNSNSNSNKIFFL